MYKMYEFARGLS